MKDHYILTKEEADQCMSAINSNNVFPIRGEVEGKLAPLGNQMTVNWIEEPLKLKNGKRAIPRIPQRKLDKFGITGTQRSQFLEIFGKEIRKPEKDEFVEKESEF